MSQHDYDISNGGGAAVRADLNLALAAVLSQNSGATAPTTTRPFMPWYDTTVGVLKFRNGADTAWVSAIEAIGGTQGVGFRNKLINGGFDVNQRNYVSGAATTAGQYTLDRWKVTGTGGITFSVVANATTVTIPSGQTLQQVVEGLSLDTGTYVLSWEGTAQGRIAGGSYGASGTVTASITGGVNTTVEFNTGTLSNVQLEASTIASPFERRHFGVVAAMCQRYYFQAGSYLNRYAPGAGPYGVGTVHFPPMRVTPSVALVGTPTYIGCSSATITPNGINSALISATTAGATELAVTFVYSASAEL